MNIYFIIQAFIIGASIVFYTIPVIVKISKLKNLYDYPNERKINKTLIPNLGGIALFLGISIASFLSLNKIYFVDFRYMMTGILIMFFVGLKDDILDISPRSKIIFQVLAALVIVIPGDMRFTNLHGIFGIYDINYFWSVFLSVLSITAITNAINLIDGIDGLASSIGVLASVAFGCLFIQVDKFQYATICFAVAGSLIAFLYFNLFGTKNKIFMGDTGSLILGIILSILVIKFNEFSLDQSYPFSNFSPTLSLAIVLIPLFDMVRVFLSRLVRGKSPFYPDKSHIHHKLLSLEFSHLKSTMVLIALNLFFIGIVFFLRNLTANSQILLLITIAFLLFNVPNYFIKKNQGKPLQAPLNSSNFEKLKDFLSI